MLVISVQVTTPAPVSQAMRSGLLARDAHAYLSQVVEPHLTAHRALLLI